MINITAASQMPSTDKYNLQSTMTQQLQPPAIPPLSLQSACSASSVQSMVNASVPVVSKESVIPSSILPSVFDPVLESPPQGQPAIAINNVQKYDKPPAPVITSASQMHSMDGE